MMKNKFLVITLISALILSCSAFIIWMVPEKAMADGETPAATPVIKMVGASIRTADPYGLRFEAEVSSDDDAEGVEFGMYLCPTDFLTNGEFPTDLGSHLVGQDEEGKDNVPDSTYYIKKVVIPRNTLIDSTEHEGKKVVRLALIDIKDCNIDRKFSAMAYIIKGGTETKATPITRSISYVARAATAGPEPELSEGQDGYAFVSGIIADSNDFFITAAGMDAVRDETTNNLTHKVTLAANETRNIDLYLDNLDERFKDNDMCMIKLSAKAGAEGITIDGQAVGIDSTEITVKNPVITGNKVTLKACGSGDLCLDDVRAITMKPLGIRIKTETEDGMELCEKSGVEGAIARNHSTLTYKEETGTVAYYAGMVDSKWGNVKFSTGSTIGADEYLVIKFKYYSDMETYYFGPDTYSDEGLWIQGYDFTSSEDGKSGHSKDYFSTFDENYFDYTLYVQKDGDTSYEGNDMTVPYGSFHGTKGITTMPDTWYYAVAPVAGNYQTIGSCNNGMHIEIAEMYSLKSDIKEKLFVAQNYPTFINLPYSEKRIVVGDEITPDIAGNSIKSVTADKLVYSASPENIVTITDGTIKGVAAGECVVTISLNDGSCEEKTIKVTVLPGPEEFSDASTPSSITSLGLENLSVNTDNATLSAKTDSTCGRIYSVSENAPEDNKTRWRNQQIVIGGERRVGDGEYLVIKFRYFDDMYFAADSPGDEGLWFLGHHGETGDKDDNYFSIFSEQRDNEGHCYDYTYYKNNDGVTPYGSYHGTKGLTTMPGTWYFAVAPVAGDWYSISTYFDDAHLEIAGVYAVASDKITSDNALFKKGNHPKSINVTSGIYLKKDETMVLSTLNIPADSMNITESELVYTVPENNGVVTIAEGVLTAVGTGTCKITVALTDGSISKEVVVNVDDGKNLSLARLYVAGDGPYGEMTDTFEGYKYYDSFGNKYGASMIGIHDVPSDKYIVLKFQYIAQENANDFYMYRDEQHGQELPEYLPAAGRKNYEYGFIFDAETKEDMTPYDTNKAPWDYPEKEMIYGNWYYWVSPNKGAYRGYTSDQPLKCIISNVYAYTAEERQEIFGIGVSVVTELSLDRLSVVAREGNAAGSSMGAIQEVKDEGGELLYKYRKYDSSGNKQLYSEIGIADAPEDKYIVLKFKYSHSSYIEEGKVNDFYMYKGEGQALPEYRTGAESEGYDYAFIFNADTMEDMTNYNVKGVPHGNPKPMTEGDWYYWVSPNKGAYEGFTSDEPLICEISNVYAYNAQARFDIFGIAVKEEVQPSE